MGISKKKLKIKPKDCHKIINSCINCDDVHDLVYDIDKSKGCYIYDSLNERYVLDCVTFFATNPLGYNHPSLFEKNFNKKLLKTARVKPANGEFYTIEYAEFVDSFCKLAKPKEFKYIFFIEGGSAAVENAIKVAIDYKIRKIHGGIQDYNPLVNLSNGLRIIAIDGGYHGRGGYTMSLSSNQHTKSYAHFPRYESWLIQKREEEFVCCPSEIAAIILEPIQSVGGDYHFSESYLRYVRDFCNEHDIILIYDEIQTGMGITGKLWCYQNFEYATPDILVFGKKVQVCGMMVSDKLDSAGKEHAFTIPSRLGSTFSGSLVDMVRSEQYIKTIINDNLIQNSKEVGEYFLDKLTILSKKYSQILNPRGRGLLCAFDLPTKAMRDELISCCLDYHDVLLFGCGENTIRFRPPLIFSKKEVDCVCDVLEEFFLMVSDIDYEGTFFSS